MVSVLDSIKFCCFRSQRDNAYRKQIMGKLHYQAQHGKIDRVQKLLDSGEDINEQDERGVTPLSFAASSGQVEMIHFLIDHGADTEASTPAGATPLISAIGMERRNSIEALLDRGANIEARIENGDTPLHRAAQAQPYQKLVTLLCERGADVNSKNNLGSTPLHNAAWFGITQNVEMLLAAGADPMIQSDKGETALDYALERGKEDTAEVLRQAMAGK